MVVEVISVWIRGDFLTTQIPLKRTCNPSAILINGVPSKIHYFPRPYFVLVSDRAGADQHGAQYGSLRRDPHGKILPLGPLPFVKDR